MAANGAICEAFKDEQKIHILDFEIGQGSQYISLIKALAERPGLLHGLLGEEHRLVAV